VKIHLLVLLLLFCLIASSVFAETFRGSCQIEFSGTTTLHDFSGQADCRPFTLSVTEGRKSELVVESSEFSVPVASMNTNSKTRDKKMHAMLEVEKFSLIKGQPAQLTPEQIHNFLNGRTDKEEAIEFNLKIRNIVQSQKAQVSNLQENDDQLTFVLEFDLSLKSYQLKPPSFLGLIRAGDRIHLKIPVRLIKENSEDTPLPRE
jgi:YceI-like domain